MIKHKHWFEGGKSGILTAVAKSIRRCHIAPRPEPFTIQTSEDKYTDYVRNISGRLVRWCDRNRTWGDLLTARFDLVPHMPVIIPLHLCCVDTTCAYITHPACFLSSKLYGAPFDHWRRCRSILSLPVVSNFSSSSPLIVTPWEYVDTLQTTSRWRPPPRVTQ